ncbi:hypothetical protein ACS0TY_004802 [Phlomoides rotata]
MQGQKYHVFTSTLKKLNLVGPLDTSIVGSLPNLQVLKLKDDACDGDTWEKSYGEFPQLKFLLIDGSTKLKHWVTENDYFPRLKRLVLHHCWFLQEIPDSIGEISTLELIQVARIVIMKRSHTNIEPIARYLLAQWPFVCMRSQKYVSIG